MCMLSIARGRDEQGMWCERQCERPFMQYAHRLSSGKPHKLLHFLSTSSDLVQTLARIRSKTVSSRWAYTGLISPRQMRDLCVWERDLLLVVVREEDATAAIGVVHPARGGVEATARVEVSARVLAICQNTPNQMAWEICDRGKTCNGTDKLAVRTLLREKFRYNDLW